MSNRIIASFLLIRGVITTGTIGARNSKIQFLLVIEFALQLHADGSHRNHNGAIARQFRSQVHRFAAWSLRRNQYRVNAHAARFLEAQIAELGRTRTSGLGSASDRQIGTRSKQIHPKDAAPGRLQKLNRNLSEQTQTDHRDRVAERDFRRADTVQADRADRTEGSLFVGNFAGNLRR